MATIVVVEDLAAPSVIGRGGHAMWVIQMLRGLERLGHQVVFVEYMDDRPEPRQVDWFEAVISHWWHLGRAALLVAPGWRSVAGLRSDEVADIAARATTVLTLSAHYRAEPWPLLEGVRPRVLWDADPGYTQSWAAGGDPAEIYGIHDVHLSVGLGLGRPECRAPTLGLDWKPVLPPVVLDLWPCKPAPRAPVTTVAGWRDYGWLEVDGVLFGPKVEQFRAFIDLPARSGEQLHVVSELEPDDPDRALLENNGWVVRPPAAVGDPARYRRFVLGSAGEFSCAKGGYIGTRCGWFSDRSACYLAAGRPVVLQATGYEDLLPTGEGLFAPTDVEEAAAALIAVRQDYPRQAAAARRLAETHFDSDKVLAAALLHAGID